MPTPDVRIAALSALYELAGEKSLPTFLEALLSDEEADVRMEIISVLRDLRSIESVEALIDILRSDPDPDVRREAALTLAVIKDNRALHPLFEARSFDTSFDVRESADIALKLWTRPDLEPILTGGIRRSHTRCFSLDSGRTQRQSGDSGINLCPFGLRRSGARSSARGA